MNLPLRLSLVPSLPLGGRSFPVLFSHHALMDVELATGMNALTGEYKVLSLSAKALRATIHVLLTVAAEAAIPPAPPPFTLQEVGSAMQLRALGKVRAAVVEAWRVSMPEPDPDLPASNVKSKAKVKCEKPATWLDVWANNTQTLGLTDEQWLSYTPRMVQQRARERLEVVRQQELMLSRLGAATVNFSTCHPKQPISDGHFMVHPYPKDVTRNGSGDLISVLGGLGGLFPLAEKMAKEHLNKEE